MSSYPSQSYLRSLPPQDLVQFIALHIPFGLEYTSRELWHVYNGCRGFKGSSSVFRYAALKAGMSAAGKKLTRTP